MAPQSLVYQGLLTVQASQSHSDPPHSASLLWTSDQPFEENYTWQHSTNTHTQYRDVRDSGGNRTRNSNERAAANPRLRRGSHCDQLIKLIPAENLNWCFTEIRLKTTARIKPSFELCLSYEETQFILLMLIETAAADYRVFATIRGKTIQCRFLFKWVG